MVFAPPQRGGLRTRWRRRGKRLHGGEHLADETFRRPAEQPDGASRFADAQELVGCGLVVGCEHHAEAGDHRIELVVAKRQGLRVPLLPFQLNAAVRCLVAAGVEQLRSEVTGDDFRAHHCGGDGRVPGARGDVQDPMARIDAAGLNEDCSQLGEQFTCERRVVPRCPHGAVLLLERPVRLQNISLVIHDCASYCDGSQ
jgi:hypothetical protein